MAKQSQFKEAMHLVQEIAAAEEEGVSQAMLFAMLQEQHDKQITAMAATNKTIMCAMMEKMNALMSGGGNRWTTQQDKENTPPWGERRPPSGTDQTKKPRRNKKPSASTAKHSSSTKQTIVTSSRQARTSAGQAGSLSMPPPDRHWGSPK